MFTFGCLSGLFGVLAILWADGRLSRRLLYRLFSHWTQTPSTNL